MNWSGEGRVVQPKKTVVEYEPYPYRSEAALSLRFGGINGFDAPNRLRSALDVLPVLADAYRLDSELLFSHVRRMGVDPSPNLPGDCLHLDGLMSVDLDIEPYPAMADLLEFMESMPGFLDALEAVDSAVLQGLRGMASEILPALGLQVDRRMFARLWDSEDILGFPQDAWEPSAVVGPLLCRDIFHIESDEGSKTVPVAPKHDEIGNFPLRLVRDHKCGKAGVRLRFLTRVAIVDSCEVGFPPYDRCRLDTPHSGLPKVTGGPAA